MFKHLFSKWKLSKSIKKSKAQFEEIWDMDIKDIWELQDTNDFIIAMSGWINNKSNYGDDLEVLSKAERNFYINDLLESEVNNGGFLQFFENTSGDYANEVIESLTAIGAKNTINIYKDVLESFDKELPIDREERIDYLENTMSPKLEQVLNQCDHLFYEYQDDLQDLNYKYIMKNKSHFS